MFYLAESLEKDCFPFLLKGFFFKKLHLSKMKMPRSEGPH